MIILHLSWELSQEVLYVHENGKDADVGLTLASRQWYALRMRIETCII
jgi:hypothetical protein